MPTIIRILLFGLLFMGQVSGAVAGDHFQVTTLAPDLLMLSTDQGSYCTNSLVFTGEDGILLVDTHGNSDREAFKKFIDGLGLGAPRYIINTHRHEEHIGGNALFGPDPVIVAHHLLPEKLRSGAFLFSEYPPDSYPDITVSGSYEISFNGEIIRLVDIGGSHDDNEIMVYFTHHKIAHLSSVVNGFNFPSVDSDGDVLKFEPIVRRLMTLLPRDVRLISGHNGRASGFDFVGRWDQLPAYAEMMKSTVAIVGQGLADGKTLEEMQEAGILDDYKHYAGSYVGTDGWIQYIVNALTVPRENRKDICRPIFETWKKEGARAAVDRYRQLEKTRKEEFDFHETTLLIIGSKLYDRGLFEDACEFLLGCIEQYPESKYLYYSHYLAAKGFHTLDQTDKAMKHCRESINSNPEFEAASKFLEELSGTSGESADRVPDSGNTHVDSDTGSDENTDKNTSKNLLHAPQKVVVDSERNRYLVSNFEGGGDIVAIDYAGSQSYFVEDAGFIDGMVIVGDGIYGSASLSGGSVKGYHLDTGELILDLNIDSVAFLSGFTTDTNGNIYATERFGTRIIQIDPVKQTYSTLIDDASINLPNGIIFEEENNRLVFISDRPNPPIQSVRLDNLALSTLAETTLAGADGIGRDGQGNYYITGYYLPAVYKMSADLAGRPEIIHKENHLVYPTYNEKNNSILTTNYNQHKVVEIFLDTVQRSQ